MLRKHARCTWRQREGARHVYHTAMRRACSSLRPGRSSTAAVHGCPRGVAPLRHPRASTDTPVAHTGEDTTPAPHHATGSAARRPLLVSPPGYGFSALEARWKPWIYQYKSGIMSEDTGGVVSIRAEHPCSSILSPSILLREESRRSSGRVGIGDGADSAGRTAPGPSLWS